MTFYSEININCYFCKKIITKHRNSINASCVDHSVAVCHEVPSGFIKFIYHLSDSSKTYYFHIYPKAQMTELIVKDNKNETVTLENKFPFISNATSPEQYIKILNLRAFL